MILYRHIKTGHLYELLGGGLDCTNTRADLEIVVYKQVDWDTLVELWHTSARDDLGNLHEFLGFTWESYQSFLHNPSLHPVFPRMCVRERQEFHEKFTLVQV